MNAALDAHSARAVALAADLRAGASGLAKDTSNLFRDRTPRGERRLDVRDFNHVIRVDSREGFMDAEGMATYEDLVEACLPQGVMPAVVPQLKTITLGGAVGGRRHRGHLPPRRARARDGARARGAHRRRPRDHVHARERARGSLLRLSQFVRDAGLRAAGEGQGRRGPAFRPRAASRLLTPHAYFTALERHCAEGDAAFVDGAVFAPDRLYLTLGRFVAEAPFASDYTFEHIYYRSIAARRERLAADARLPLALGHGLVLVLEESPRAKPAGAPPLRAQAPRIAHLREDHAWNSRVGLTRASIGSRGSTPNR
jgi:hypothetical protein